ncbi:MAG: hypothetical protein JW829_21435, partial [Pirellulales bacterium]|nr:hypothetical protein [Pirellulales bacterium]
MRQITILIAILLSGFIGSLCHAQINVPAESKEYVPIPVTVKTDIPDGARLRGPGWVIPENLNAYECSPALIIVCGPPGEYVIGYRIQWLHIEPVTFTDGNGKEITIQSYLGDGEYDTEAKFKILGPNQPNPPQPPVDPTWRIMLFYDGGQLDNLPAGQRSILTSLAIRQKLIARGHNLLEVLEAGGLGGSVPPRYAPWFAAVQGDPMP